ncbi:MAG: BF3164 family lipoprotein [Bacteroidales bacterium]
MTRYINPAPILIICLVIFGCVERPKEIIVEEFPEVITLKGSPIMNTFGGDITVIDTFLVVSNVRLDTIIHIYSTRTHELLLKIGTKGMGPGEYLDASIFDKSRSYSSSEEKLLCLFDVSRRRVTEINISESVNKSKYIFKRNRLPKIESYIQELFFYNDSIILYKGEDEGRFSIYNNKDSTTTIISYNTPNLNITFNKLNESSIFHSAICINPVNNNIAASPAFIGRIDYFHPDGVYEFSTIFEELGKDNEMAFKSSNMTQTNAKLYVVSMVSDGQFIYALNANMNYGHNRSNEIPPSNEILVFDWDGFPIKKIELDRSVSRFALDIRNNRIYGYCPYENEFPIRKYELNQ